MTRRSFDTSNFSFLTTCLIFIAFINATSQQEEASAANGRRPVEISKGINNLDTVILRNNRGSTVEVYLYGAQVMSWKNEHGEELLFLSSNATFEPPRPIRGGIQILYPQYSNTGPLPSHGFVRNRFWSIDSSTPLVRANSNRTQVDFILKSTDEDLRIWPFNFEFRFRVTLRPSGDLVLTSRIRNTDVKPCNFTHGYHPYFAVSDISKVQVKGMAKLDYLDNQRNRTRFHDPNDTITFNTEFDRIYLSTPDKIAILDYEKKRTYIVQKYNLPDAVVWNPGERRERPIADLGSGDYKRFVAVEPGYIEKPIFLKPGKEWREQFVLHAVPKLLRWAA